MSRTVRELRSWGVLLDLPRRLFPGLCLAGAVVILSLLIGLVAGQQLRSTMTEALIYMVIVVGLSIFVGNSGIVSFGHISFALIAVYATAWQSCCGPLRAIYMPGLPHALATMAMPPVSAALIGTAVATLAAFLSGAAIMRLSGAAASIATLCLLFVVKTIYENWDSWTAGQSAIAGLATFVDLRVACASAVGAIIIATLYRTSSLGLRLKAIREDEVAARAYGVNIWLHKVIAFSLSAFVVAFGGVLYGHYLGTITVSMYWLDMTFLTLAMLVVGGIRSVTGAVIGTVVIAGAQEIMQILEQGIRIGSLSLHAPDGTREIVVALALLCILIFRPNGLVGDTELGENLWNHLASSPTSGVKAMLGIAGRVPGGSKHSDAE